MMNGHYGMGEIECKDAIKAALTPDEWRGFCKGNIIKYVWRERYKGSSASDIKKSMDYVNWLLEELERDEALELACPF